MSTDANGSSRAVPDSGYRGGADSEGYASVLDGPGAMGGAINLVTRKPTKALEAEGSLWTGGRSDTEGWNGYAMIGTRQPKYSLIRPADVRDGV